MLLLFNMNVQKSIIQKTGTILNKTVHLLGYTDDIEIALRSEQALMEAFISFETAARKFSLIAYEQKTKYM